MMMKRAALARPTAASPVAPASCASPRAKRPSLLPLPGLRLPKQNRGARPPIEIERRVEQPILNRGDVDRFVDEALEHATALTNALFALAEHESPHEETIFDQHLTVRDAARAPRKVDDLTHPRIPATEPTLAKSKS